MSYKIFLDQIHVAADKRIVSCIQGVSIINLCDDFRSARVFVFKTIGILLSENKLLFVPER